MEWIKCVDDLPKINSSGYKSDPVLVIFKSEDGTIDYRVDTYIVEHYHRIESYRWNKQKHRKGFREDYLAWMPIPEYKDGE